LAHLVETIRTRAAPAIPSHHPPSYSLEQSVSSLDVVERPSGSERTGPGYRSPATPAQMHSRKRMSYPSPVAAVHSPGSAYSIESEGPPPYSAPPGMQSFPLSDSQSSSTASTSCSAHEVSLASPLEGNSPINPFYDGGNCKAEPVDENFAYPTSHGVPAPYTARQSQAASQDYYDEEVDPQLVYPCAMVGTADALRQSFSVASPTDGWDAAPFDNYVQEIPPAPLLTTPYHPPSYVFQPGFKTNAKFPTAVYNTQAFYYNNALQYSTV
jgi:hypothetical protein